MSYVKYKDLGSLPSDKPNNNQKTNMILSPPMKKTSPIGMAQPMGSVSPMKKHNTSQPMTISSNSEPLPSGSYLIQNINDKKQLINSNKLVIVYIWGDFCGPCKHIAPRYEELSNKYNDGGNVILAKENVNLQLSSNVRGVPTFHFYLNSELVDQMIGADISSLETSIVNYMKNKEADDYCS